MSTHPMSEEASTTPMEAVRTQVALLVEKVGKLEEAVAQGHIDHRDMAMRINSLERRIDTLVANMESINLQLKDFIIGVNKRIDTLDDEHDLIRGRIESLEETADNLVESEKVRHGIKDAVNKRNDQVRLGINIFTAIFMAALAWMTYVHNLSH